MTPKKVTIPVEDDYEDLELRYPLIRLKEAGHSVTIVGSGRSEMFKSKHGYEVKAGISADMTDQEEFDAVIIPGGFTPDRLRRFPAVNEFVKRMFQEGRWWRQFTMAGLSWLRRTSSGAGRSLASYR